MTPILWALIAVTVAFLFVVLAARMARGLRPSLDLPPGESLPSTPFQRLAERTLAVSAVLVVAAVAIVAKYGPEVYWDDDRVRLTVTGLMLAVLALVAVLLARVSGWMLRGREGGNFDEHDRAVLAGAPMGQGGAMLIVLAAWIIGLVETHHDTRQVSTVFLYLIFWSCVMASLLAWLAGIVIGYRRH